MTAKDRKLAERKVSPILPRFEDYQNVEKRRQPDLDFFSTSLLEVLHAPLIIHFFIFFYVRRAKSLNQDRSIEIAQGSDEPSP